MFRLVASILAILVVAFVWFLFGNHQSSGGDVPTQQSQPSSGSNSDDAFRNVK